MTDITGGRRKMLDQVKHQKSGVKTNSGCNTPSNH